MSSQKTKVVRCSGISLAVLIGFFSLIAFPALKGIAASPENADDRRQMKIVKAEIESLVSSPDLIKRYDRLASLHNPCSPFNQMISSARVNNVLSPTASLCINGALSVGDLTYNRPVTQTTGTGFGLAGTCTLSGSATAVRYDIYGFTLSGCAAFPTVVTATLCGPAGCSNLGNVDTVLTLYRAVAAGDPLTANGGVAVFNAASPCTNARALNDDQDVPATNTNGSTCNQLNTADCLPVCVGGDVLSGMKRSLGSGSFSLVVAGFANTTTGNYNLFVDAPGAGCTLSLASTAANTSISGRVVTSGGRGITNVTVSLSGGSLAEPMYARTSAFGYYNFQDVPVGQSYVLSVSAKRFTFVNSSVVVNLQDSIADVDFVSEQ